MALWAGALLSKEVLCLYNTLKISSGVAVCRNKLGFGHNKESPKEPMMTTIRLYREIETMHVALQIERWAG